MSKEFPHDLIKAYTACKKSDWADDKYDAFKKQAAKYLKSYSDDKLEHCKLVVDLTRATSDLFKGKQDDKEEKGAKKGKTVKKSTRNSGSV